jgi:site-specific DNA-methyltransferase (adenine-specific)
MLELNKIYNMDLVEGMRQIDDESISLVMADPPYARKYLYLYEAIANECPRIMKQGASLISIVPHFSLPEVIKIFDGKLKYRWALCMNQFDGSHARLSMGIEVMWKLQLWWVRGSFKFNGMTRDGVIIKGRSGQTKKHHKWEQDQDWCDYYIKRLCPENGIVLDPTCGSSPFALSCLEQNKNYIGFDINPEYCKIANDRIFEYKNKLL